MRYFTRNGCTSSDKSKPEYETQYYSYIVEEVVCCATNKYRRLY